MRILGVDPGTLRTGVGLVETTGNRYKLLHATVISADAKYPLARRLYLIYKSLTRVIETFRPDAVALENIFFAKNIQSMVKIGEARACAMLAASEQGIDVLEYPPALVKQSVTGNGRATKEQIQAMVKRLLNLTEEPPTDAADALAVAICHVHHHKSREFQKNRSSDFATLISKKKSAKADKEKEYVPLSNGAIS